MLGQFGRVLLQIMAPVSHAEEAHGWATLLWQAIVIMGLGAGAASFLTNSPSAIAIYLLLLALGVTFAGAYRLQGRVDHIFTREQLLDARVQLGQLISDAADLLNGVPGDPKALQVLVIQFDECVLDTFRSKHNATFDESHAGRYYAAIMEPGADTNTVEGLLTVLRAEIAFLNGLTAEINAEINALPR